MRDQEERKLVDMLNRQCNRASRCEFGLELALKELGFDDDEQKEIIKQVKEADFSLLRK